MPNILILDHKFNIQSLSAISSTHKELLFFEYNTEYSFFDNYDLVKPDLFIVNNHFYKIKQEKALPCKILDYTHRYIIPNKFVKINHDKNLKPILIVNRSDTRLDNKTIEYDNRYVGIYSLHPKNNYYHYQYMGHVASCKSLHNLINAHKTVLVDDDILRDVCLYLNCSCKKYPHNTKNNIELNSTVLNNIEFYDKYISSLL